MATPGLPPSGSAFRHEALLYTGDADYAARAVPRVCHSLERREQVLIVVPVAKIDLLKQALGEAAADVTFGDAGELGRNPARLIALWRRFTAQRLPGQHALGISEAVTAARSPDELAECHRHEALVNTAFAGSGAWTLLCPYDATALPAGTVAAALRTHPYVSKTGRNTAYDPHLPADPLPPPPDDRAELALGDGPLDALHAFVRAHAGGLAENKVNDLDLAVHELAINTVRHAGGRGLVLLWNDATHVVCEVRDGGFIADPLVGREDPSMEQESGRGLWIVNQLCDLVQVRSSAAGTVVRVKVALG